MNDDYYTAQEQRNRKQKEYQETAKVTDGLLYLSKLTDPGRSFQQLIYDVHERIYDNTGSWPEKENEYAVTNRDYIDAISSLLEEIE